MHRIPNILSILRIFASITMLFFFNYPKVFIPLYLFAGISDVLDGYIARRLKATSTLGARLDSIGDTFFFIILLLYLVNTFQAIIMVFLIPIIIITTIKFLNIIIGFIKFRKLTMLHTIANKLAGFLIYCIPLFIWLNINKAIWAVVAVSLFAAVQELIILSRTSKNNIDLNLPY